METPHELFIRHPDNPILTGDRWPYPANTVFNAAAVRHDGETLMLVRVEDRTGVSHLTVARSTDGLTNWRVDEAPSFLPETEDEQWGVEDPRITWLEEEACYAVTYTAYCPNGPKVGLATTKDFKSYERLGVVLPPANKDAALFPHRVDGKWLMLHRPYGGDHNPAHVWIASSPDLQNWGHHKVVLRSQAGPHWDAAKIGLSAQPIETDKGWLVLYHGVKNTCFGSIYRQGLAMLDLKDPSKVIARTPHWVFSPIADYERYGDVGNVVFSCGWVLHEGMVHMYYGGADTCMAVASAPLPSVLDALRPV